MAVRLTQKDKDKLKRINNSVRRKNKQMENYNIDFYMPVLTPTKVKSRKQLNDYLEGARAYTRGYGFKYRQNKYGVVASLSEIAEAKRIAEAVTRERAKRFKEIAPKEFKSRGKGTGSSIMQRKLMSGRRNDDKYSIYDPVKFRFGSFMNRKQLDKRIENLSSQLSPNYIENKNIELKENILKAIQRNWGNKSKKIQAYIKNMSPTEVVDEFMSEDIFDFDYIYDENEIDRQIEIFESTYNIT